MSWNRGRFAPLLRIAGILVVALVVVVAIEDRGHQKIDAKGLARLNRIYGEAHSLGQTIQTNLAACAGAVDVVGCRAAQDAQSNRRLEGFLRDTVANYRAAAAEAHGACRTTILAVATDLDAASRTYAANPGSDAARRVGVQGEQRVAHACGLKLTTKLS